MSKVKDVINKFDQSSNAMAEQKEAVKALEELGKAKADIFEKEINKDLLSAGKDETNQKVPISFIVGSTYEVRAFSKSEVGNIGTVVSDSLTNFLSGDKKRIIGGIGNLITSTLGTFLGESEAMTEDRGMYCIGTDGLSPVRIDVRSWYYGVTAESITKKMERITAIVAVKSVIDVTQIDLATFLYLYQKQFEPLNFTPEEMKRLLNDAAEIFNIFVSKNAPSNPAIAKANTPDDAKKAYAKTIGVMS
ncbi:MAG: hypothetical protein LKK19_06250 [Bacteroidales bacterium]|jgi:hypothetical protein|nr:hypothetical protein [Bacteroidales bacterium]MCI2122287.1 hypothetical protein [Bacteroidales bacterium]MCI2145752.1 hypothetical protein [Bacteroidales bacterium]